MDFLDRWLVGHHKDLLNFHIKIFIVQFSKAHGHYRREFESSLFYKN
jgi:hypothetical protein